MYDDYHYAEARLTHTYIRYKGLPVYVKQVRARDARDRSKIDLRLFTIGTTKSFDRDINNKWLDYTPIPLGYVNHDGRAYYLSRMPQRRYKQGLDATSVRVKRHPNELMPADTVELLGIPLYKAFKEGYPSYAQALALIDSGNSSVAFHNKLGIVKEKLGNKYLTYKGNQIGWLENNEIKLSKQFKYLYEMLTKEGVRCHVAA